MKNISIAILLLCLVPLTVSCKKTTVETDETVYFMVSEITPSHNDSFILPLVDPVHIDMAREIIKDIHAPNSRIVTARIARGNGDGKYVNRDLLDPGGRLWSWYVIEFTGFADVTIEIHDGWPTYVEGNLDVWMTQTGGRIGFWSYTVTREVDPREIR